MKTLGDVYAIIQQLETEITLFGAESESGTTRRSLLRAVGQAVCEENDLPFGDPSVVKRLPLDTPLGPKATEALRELEEWANQS